MDDIARGFVYSFGAFVALLWIALIARGIELLLT